MTTEDFLNSLVKDLPYVLKHDYIKNAQSDYFRKTKNLLTEGEFVVCLDFAENYTCVVQNAIQSFHWSAKQATLHPYAIYYKQDGKIKNKNFVVISERVQHDTNCVHLFNDKMIAYLKSEFGSENVKKIYYFSDGAASQYKNKLNFLNLTYYQEDYNIEIESNFFDNNVKPRYLAAKTITNTCQYHSFTPTIDRQLKCKIISNDVDSVIKSVVKKTKK